MMISRVVTVQIQPDKLDEAVRIYQECLLPIIRQQAGYQRVFVLTDRPSNKLMIVGLWNSHADLNAADADTRIAEQVKLFSGTFAGRPTIENLEVRLQD